MNNNKNINVDIIKIKEMNIYIDVYIIIINEKNINNYIDVYAILLIIYFIFLINQIIKYILFNILFIYYL